MGGRKGVLVMALFPTVVIAYLGADFIKALLCVQHLPQWPHACQAALHQIKILGSTASLFWTAAE